MTFLRAGKLRYLYLLALIQLVGGPLVLLQVTVFCQMTAREAPRSGLATATTRAWKSPEFQAALNGDFDHPSLGESSLRPGIIQRNKAVAGKKSGPDSSRDPKASAAEKSKLPITPWKAEPVLLTIYSSHCRIIDRARTWTPAWPQAPPGPPPRLV